MTKEDDENFESVIEFWIFENNFLKRYGKVGNYPHVTGNIGVLHTEIVI